MYNRSELRIAQNSIKTVSVNVKSRFQVFCCCPRHSAYRLLDSFFFFLSWLSISRITMRTKMLHTRTPMNTTHEQRQYLMKSRKSSMACQTKSSLPAATFSRITCNTITHQNTTTTQETKKTRNQETKANTSHLCVIEHIAAEDDQAQVEVECVERAVAEEQVGQRNNQHERHRARNDAAKEQPLTALGHQRTHRQTHEHLTTNEHDQKPTQLQTVQVPRKAVTRMLPSMMAAS